MIKIIYELISVITMTDEEAVIVVSDSQLSEDVASRRAEVDKLLAKKDKSAALFTALQNPPVLTKSGDIKVSCMWP